MPICGDGVVEQWEECDDGNTDDQDGCTAQCRVARCGDGIVRIGAEECDDGNEIDSDECLATCVTARCGDGVVQAGVEACDDGNTDDNDACIVVVGISIVTSFNSGLNHAIATSRRNTGRQALV